MKRLTALILAVLMMTVFCACDMGGDDYVPGSGTAVAEGDSATRGDYIYKVVEGGVEISKYIGNDTDVVIPDTISGQKILAIGEGAFADRYTLKSVDIPDTVVTIGKNAFRRCYKLEEVKGCEGVMWIGDEAFYYDESLKAYPWTENITAIGTRSFSWCSSLEKILIVSNCDTIGDYAFRNCTGATELKFEDNTVKAIGKEAFMCLFSITSLHYPYATDFIGEGAFKHASSLTKITFDNRVTKIANRAFQNSQAIEEIIVPSHITHIEEIAFGSCRNLKTLRIENPDLVECGIHICLQLNDVVTIYFPEECDYMYGYIESFPYKYETF